MRSVFKQMVVLLAVAVIPASGSAWLDWRQEKWAAFRDESVPLSQLLAYQKRLLWVDARSSEDFKTEHIPGALHLTEDDWNGQVMELLAAWEPGRVVVVYCSSRACQTGQEVAKRLRQEVGLEAVFSLRGGWEAWKGAAR